MTPEEVLDFAHEEKAILTKVRHEMINNDPDNLFKITPHHIEIANKNGISRNTVHGRVYNMGWTVQEAITVPIQKGFTKPEGYYDYQRIAYENAISNSMFYSRIKRGWSLEKASTLPKINKTKRTRSDAEWIDKAIENGISYKTYLGRTRNGWTPEEAATTRLLEKGKEYLNEERKENSRIAFEEFRLGSRFIKGENDAAK